MGLHVNETLLNDEKYKKAAQKELKDFMEFVNGILDDEGKNADSKASAFFDLCTGKKDTVKYLNGKDEEITLSFKALKADKISTMNMTGAQIVDDLFGAFGESVEEVNGKLGLYSEQQLEDDEFFIHYTMLHGQVTAPSSEINIGVEFSEEEIAENQKEIAENSFGKEFSDEREVSGKETTGLHVNETLLNDEKYRKAAQKELKDFLKLVDNIGDGKNEPSKASAFFDLCTGKKDTVTYLNSKDEEITLSFKALKADKISTKNMSKDQILEDLFGAFKESIEEVNGKLGLYSEKQLEDKNFSVHFITQYMMMHDQVTFSSSKANVGVEFSEAEIAENKKEIAENSFGKEFSSEREANEKSVKTLLNDVKNKTTEYNRINLFRRALSYINPFKDSVRELREDINDTKEFLTQNGIDKDQLENFANGKADIDSVDLNNVEQVEEFDARSTLNAQETRGRWPVDEEVESSIGEMDGPQENEKFIEAEKDVEIVLGDDVNIE